MGQPSVSSHSRFLHPTPHTPQARAVGPMRTSLSTARAPEACTVLAVPAGESSSPMTCADRNPTADRCCGLLSCHVEAPQHAALERGDAGDASKVVLLEHASRPERPVRMTKVRLTCDVFFRCMIAARHRTCQIVRTLIACSWQNFCNLYGSPRTGVSGVTSGLHCAALSPRGGLHPRRPCPQVGLPSPGEDGVINIGYVTQI
jgi:hypothetical protein